MSKVVQLRKRGFAPLRWPDRGTDVLATAHAEYARARVGTAYVKRMRLRSLPEGLLIPYWRPDGSAMDDFARVRLLPARPAQKFSQPAGSGTYFYFAPLTGEADWQDVCEDISKPIYIAEGEFKAAALAQHGLAALGIGGVNNWLQRKKNGASVSMPDFELVAWHERKAVLVFDADAHHNEQIQIALIRLAAHLRSLKAKVVLKLVPDLGDGKTGVDDLIAEKGFKAFRKLPERTLDEKEFADWGLAKTPSCTDVGNSARFVLMHSDRVRYVHEWKSWLLWDGTRWQRDATESVWIAARETMRGIYREALETPDRREELAKWAVASESTARIESMLRQARNQRAVALSAPSLDAHPYLLSVPNGVIDLTTGKLQPHDPTYLLTKQSPVVFDPDVQAPTFERFVSEIMGDDPSLVAYLQRVIGYLLTGDTREQCFFVWHGVGANGKSTLLRVVMELLGDFATSTRMETWAAQARTAGGASEDLARLQGARMASAVEAEEDQRLAESLVKELTGQDRVTARRLYQDSFEFVPQFKLILVCNHKPTIRGDDPAVWRRVRLVPFEKVFAPDQQDKDLITKLRAELPGILNWALAGCLEWLRIGLAEPSKIEQATARYRSESDVLMRFIQEECEVAETLREGAAALYQCYRAWADRNGHRAMSATRFGNRMEEKGWRRKRTKQGVRYRGLSIRKPSR